MNHFMRAHGYLPGPTQRPVAAGLLSGAFAVLPSLFFAWYSGALDGVVRVTGAHPAAVICTFVAVMVVGGGLYGRVFMRAANDRRGGWLFGIGFGFLLWMLGPSTMFYWLRHAPLVTGRASQALFGSHLLYGLALGLSFPLVHTVLQRRLLWVQH